MRDGKIVRNDAYTDNMTIGRKLGLMPPLGSPVEERMSKAFNVRTKIAGKLVAPHGTPEEVASVERMSHSLVNKLLHGPIQEIKARAEAGSPLESSEIRRRLLALDGLDVELHRPRHESP